MIQNEPYENRREAGRILAEHVKAEIEGQGDVVVLALPRGGVPVGLEVARALDAMLDVFVVRKLGVPGHEEFAMGAIATGGIRVLNDEVVSELGISEAEIARIAARETEELRRREKRYRGNRVPVDVSGRLIVLVDDGLATGSTMRAAIAALEDRRPRRIVVAVPVGAPDTCADIQERVGTLVCPLQPESFRAVGLWYRDFAPTTDDEVTECLSNAARAFDTSHLNRKGR